MRAIPIQPGRELDGRRPAGRQYPLLGGGREVDRLCFATAELTIQIDRATGAPTYRDRLVRR
ncbi:MAG: hypothetical protein R2851_26960 [Caldilineaceae bacterium]